MIDLFEVARLLSHANVEFVIVGWHSNSEPRGKLYYRGSGYLLLADKRELKKLAEVLAPLKPCPRGIDESLPFVFD